MELLSGEDLEVRLRRQAPLPLPLVGTIFAQTASALHAAHEEGIIHRDLKPSNIFLCRQGDYSDVVKVLDFGISKMQGAQSALTRTNAIIGTPWYMSPEQARGMSAEVDVRTDIFALGAILYEMVGGHPPFHGQTPDVVLYQVVHEEPPPLGDLRRGISDALEQAVVRAMAKDREDRFISMRDFAEAVANGLDQTMASPGREEHAAKAFEPSHMALADTEDRPSLSSMEEEATVPVEIPAMEEDAPSTYPDPDPVPPAGNLETAPTAAPEHTVQGVGPQHPPMESSSAEPDLLPEMPTLLVGEGERLDQMATAAIEAPDSAPRRTTLSRSSGEIRQDNSEPRSSSRRWRAAGGIAAALALGFAMVLFWPDENSVARPPAMLDGALGRDGGSIHSPDLRPPPDSLQSPDAIQPDAAPPDAAWPNGQIRKPKSGVPPRPRQYGTLRIVARIPGGRFVNADLYVDGRPKGKTPRRISRIRVGSHRVIVRFKGYKAGGKRVDVLPNRNTTVELELKR